MPTLLGEQYAPITSSPGFLQLGLDDAVAALSSWRGTLTPDGVRAEDVSGCFPACLHQLEPLTAGARPRELLMEASRGWTAYFDCLLQGTDAVSAIGYLSQAAGCQGLAIRVHPHTVGMPGFRHGRYGSVQFDLFGPLRTDFLNYVRTINVDFDGGRWVFGANGTPQWFEETDAYRARRIRDRFTSGMLERYCQALGLDAFNPHAYGPRATLVHSDVVMPLDNMVLSLAEAQQWLEIIPGIADELQG
jgi:hypothetical protein